MKDSLKNLTFLFLTIIVTVLLKVIGWQLLINKFKPGQLGEVDYDIIDYTRLFFVSLHQLFLFIDISVILTLGVFLVFKKKMETQLIHNLYYSLIYLFISVVTIEIIF